MKRSVPVLVACLFLGLVPFALRAQSPEDLATTARRVAGLQNPDGGFGGQSGGASTLGATSSATRVLKNTGGSIPDVLACIKFIRSCVDKASGGFHSVPGDKSDGGVGTTASGLMAFHEMKIDDASTIDAALKYLEEKAKSFEEVRIAVAGFEAVGKTSPVFTRWADEILKTQNPDGTFGEGPKKARDTGGKAVALLRMGRTLDRKDAIFAFLKSAQNSDGGWSQGEGGSELDSTYRIMRAFFMAKETPDLERLIGFIARCRHSDGGYGVKPGAEASPGGTYFATTVLRWARILSGEPALVETAGFTPLFNGKDLSGWNGDTSLWSAHDGMLVGTSKGLSHNDFLETERDYRDFVLKLTFQLVRGEGNSGVQFRSVRVPGHEMSGYQADLGENFWGCLYDESRRNRVLVQASDAAVKTLKKDGWNQYTVSASGPDIRLALNGVTSVTYKETDPKISRAGKFAVQMHQGGPMEVRFKDVYVQNLPVPDESDTTTPGFHLRTLKSAQGNRKYVVYVPEETGNKGPLPVVLFLHGSGERGEDGIRQAQVGLGPAIVNQRRTFKAIAVFPQARKTWAADSEDAAAALATLDDVLDHFSCDHSKIILTGLSMGGRGAWEIASAHSKRFAAVVPVCGMGKTESAQQLAALPVWAFVGDADRDATVLNARAMVKAIAEAGGKPRYTEYRGVGHNSWDRAYNDPKWIDWVLAQSRP